MAKSDNIRGVEKIEIGLPGDGVVGATLTTFAAVVLNSLTLTGSEATEETISTEQDDSYLTVNTGANPATANFKLYEVTGDSAVMLMGGAWDDINKVWSAPKTVPNKYLSVVITTDVTEGKKTEITFAYAKVVAKFDGNITKNGLLSLDVQLTANTPVSAASVEGAPFEIKFQV
ncbi:hypothetical protein [Changchengzhania lutea]|uniref:hypothetical protein n=1 Tax=Changchengzhania lutea TaxID=2049305 RepID=UPI00115F01F5|nr:hypothetical protein [Changchengzhania lutea]